MIDLFLIKEKMLSSGCFEDNQYLTFYLQLIKQNENTKVQKFKTNKHHILPRAYFNFKNLKVDNSKTNLVNLLYKDHLLAHFYLCLCCKIKALRYKLELALQYIIDTCNIDNEFIKFMKAADEYQKLYEERKQYFSEIQLGKPGTSKGLIAITKNNKLKFVKPLELNDYLQDGWIKGGLSHPGIYPNPMQGKHHSEETKIKIATKALGRPAYNKGKPGKKWTEEQRKHHSVTQTNKKTIHLNDIEKRVPSTELKNWLDIGWSLGRALKNIEITAKNHAYPIYCFELKRVFRSFRAFCTELSLSSNNHLLKQYLDGEKDSYYDYHLEYVKEKK